MMQRIWATFYARSLEFLRDRSALGWNFILPVALVFGLAFVFSGEGQPLFKVGVVADNVSAEAKPNPALHPFLQTLHVDFYSVPARQQWKQRCARSGGIKSICCWIYVLGKCTTGSTAIRQKAMCWNNCCKAAVARNWQNKACRAKKSATSIGLSPAFWA